MPDSSRSPRLLTTSQAARELGISSRTLAQYARDGVLRPKLVLPSGHLRWSLDDLMRQLEEIQQKRQSERPSSGMEDSGGDDSAEQ